MKFWEYILMLLLPLAIITGLFIWWGYWHFLFTGASFEHPGRLWLLLVIPLIIIWYVYRHNKHYPSLRFSNLSLVTGYRSMRPMLRHLLFALRLVAIAMILIAVAKPQSATSWQDVHTEGIDIVIALDISGSMLAKDFSPNRLEAAKNVAMDFIDERPNDRVGLVLFSAKSFTQCPITTDHAILNNLFKDVKNGMIEDGTAIGLGLANAVNRLKNSQAKSKVVILLTDGFNTTGEIPPLTGAEIAKAFGVRVYTIGVGKNGKAPYPFQSPMGGIVYQNVEVRIDEATLKEIAETTGGKYFRATNNKKLAEIYQDIDKMEKTRIRVTEHRNKHDEYMPLILMAICLLLLEFLYRQILTRSILQV